MISMEPIPPFCLALDDAIEGKHLPNAGPPIDGFGQHSTDSVAYIKAVRTRLTDLGYLGKPKIVTVGKKGIQPRRRFKHSTKVDKALIGAIKRFQRDIALVDASLLVDGWAGPKTWHYLDCLVSFENKQSLAEWQLEKGRHSQLKRHNDHYLNDQWLSNPALLRATYLRLYTLGFFNSKTKPLHCKTVIDTSEHSDFAQAIVVFRNFVSLLGLGEPATKNLDESLLHHIFNYDEMIRVIAEKSQKSPSFFQQLLQSSSQILSAIACVELWMLGYDISPNEEKNHGSEYLQKTIKAFWRDVPNPGGHSQLRENSLTPVTKSLSADLFYSFHTLLNTNQTEDFSAEDLNDKINGIIQSKKGHSQLKTAFKKIASSIWDGIKRARKWLFNILKGAFVKSLDLITNLARYISRQARMPFVYLTKAVHILHSGISYGFDSLFSQSQSGVIAIGKGVDFDQSVLIDPSASSKDLSSVLVEYQKANSTYVTATKIIAQLIKIFKRVSLLISNAAGWLIALISLSELYQSIESIKNDIDQYEMDISHPQSIFKAQIS